MFHLCEIYIREKFGSEAIVTSVIEIDGGIIISYYFSDKVVGIIEENVTNIEWKEFVQNQKIKGNE